MRALFVALRKRGKKLRLVHRAERATRGVLRVQIYCAPLGVPSGPQDPAPRFPLWVLLACEQKTEACGFV